MERKEISHTEHFPAVIDAMASRGLLLAAYDSSGKANAMALGWATFGGIWSMPMCIAMVRPSRYTYQCIEHSGCFTVNVAGADLAKACLLCGTKSGRDGDKLAEAGLTVEKALTVEAPVIAECPIVYECKVVHHNDILPPELADEVQRQWYADGDYHRVYFGKILTTQAAHNAAELLG
jgi:flavin reductase (DIM6/NTAB) family NADH-FMN oxidoreductase RutF